MDSHVYYELISKEEIQDKFYVDSDTLHSRKEVKGIKLSCQITTVYLALNARLCLLQSFQ